MTTNLALAIDVTESMILLDQQLEEWLKKSSANHEFVQNEKKIPASAYFLLGSFSSDGDIHVAHASKCPVHSSALEEQANEKSRMLDGDWMADNAERLIRLLPGGIHIVGVAWFSSKETFVEKKAMIHRTLARILKMNNSLSTAGIDASISEHMITVFFETTSTTPIGAIVDVANKTGEIGSKVSFQKLEWISLVSNTSARISHNVPIHEGKQSDFYNDFVVATKNFANNFFKCDMMLLDGQLREDNEPLIKDTKGKNKKTSVEAQLFIDPLYNRESGAIDDIASNMHEILFDIEIRASVPLRSNVKDAKRALKQHLIRNLYSRAELHYESMEIVEEAKTPASCSVHQLPRPATTVLHSHPSILLNDFLFEADNIEDAQKNFDDMMDIETSIEHVDDGWERALSPEEMEAVRTPLEDLRYVDYDASSDSCCSTKTLLITVAIIIALLASIIYFTVAHS